MAINHAAYNRVHTFTVATCLYFLVVSTLYATPVHYTVTDLGTLGGASYATSVNESGEVVGYSSLSNGSYRAFYWDGSMQSLGTFPGGAQSYAYSINNTGQITGYSDRRYDPREAFLWDGVTLQHLGTYPNGLYSVGSGINDEGQIVGVSLVGNYSHAMLWDNGNIFDLGTLDNRSSTATAINNLNQVVGYSTVGTYSHAFLWDEGNMLDLGTLGGRSSSASAINDRGEVAGDSRITGDQTSHAFLWSEGSMLDLGTLGGLYSVGIGINDRGWVTGYSSTGSTNHAFLHDGTAMWDLNELLDGAGREHWVLSSATDISNSGFIVGYGTYMGQNHAFLLTPQVPIPEPATLSMILAGLASAGARSVLGKRRR